MPSSYLLLPLRFPPHPTKSLRLLPPASCSAGALRPCSPAGSHAHQRRARRLVAAARTCIGGAHRCAFLHNHRQRRLWWRRGGDGIRGAVHGRAADRQRRGVDGPAGARDQGEGVIGGAVGFSGDKRLCCIYPRMHISLLSVAIPQPPPLPPPVLLLGPLRASAASGGVV